MRWTRLYLNNLFIEMNLFKLQLPMTRIMNQQFLVDFIFQVLGTRRLMHITHEEFEKVRIQSRQL